MRTPSRSRAGIAILAACALWNCGGGGSSSPTSPSPPAAGQPNPGPSAQAIAVNIVGSIGNSAFSPNPVKANAGDTVTFRNNDSALHHIVLDDGSADLGTIAPGATSRNFTVQSATPQRFHCMNHPSMVGSINGDAAPEPPPCPDPYGYGC